MDVLLTAGLGVSAALRGGTARQIIAINPQPEAAIGGQTLDDADEDAVLMDTKMDMVLEEMGAIAMAVSSGEASLDEAADKWAELSNAQLSPIPEPDRAVAAREIRRASRPLVEQMLHPQQPAASTEPPWEDALRSFDGEFAWVHAAPTRRFSSFEKEICSRAMNGSWQHLDCQTEWPWLEQQDQIVRLFDSLER